MRKGTLLLPVGWAVIILLLTSIPNAPSVGPDGSDKVAHFAVYFVLGALCVPYLARSPRSGRSAILVYAAILFFAAADELHQVLIPGRSASAGDWLADAAGAFAGLSITTYLLNRRRISP